MQALVGYDFSELSCHLCWEIYKNPHRLNACQHAYCLECIQKEQKCYSCHFKKINVSCVTPDPQLTEKIAEVMQVIKGPECQIGTLLVGHRHSRMPKEIEDIILDKINQLEPLHIYKRYMDHSLLYWAVQTSSERVVEAILKRGPFYDDEVLEVFWFSTIPVLLAQHGRNPMTPARRDRLFKSMGFGGRAYAESAQYPSCDTDQWEERQLDHMLAFWGGDINARMEKNKTLMHRLLESYYHGYVSLSKPKQTVDDSIILKPTLSFLKRKPDLTAVDDEGQTPVSYLMLNLDKGSWPKGLEILEVLISIASPEILNASYFGKTIKERLREYASLRPPTIVEQAKAIEEKLEERNLHHEAN